MHRPPQYPLVALASALGMRFTGDSIESEEEGILLTAAGCIALQGCYFGRLMPACELRERNNLCKAVT